MRRYANDHRREPYKMQSLAKRPNEKLSPRFYGPYRVQQRIGEVAYKLELPGEIKIHPVFHPLPIALTENHELQLPQKRFLTQDRMTEENKKCYSSGSNCHHVKIARNLHQKSN
ncbi:hypothetical protein CR513_08762, partial [Mucuna pruriens]